MSVISRIHDWWMNSFADAAKTALDDISHVETATNPARPYPVAIGHEPLRALYFTMHPNNVFRVANPQPELPQPRMRVRLLGSTFHSDASLKVQADQLRFLLAQAPMIDAPTDLFNAGRAVTKFAYVHPKTFAAFTKGAYAPKTSAPYVQLSPSRTKWVLTTLMPEKVVIYTPNPMPGIEKLLAQ